MLEIILFLYGIGKQLAVEWDVLKGLTEPTDASSSQHSAYYHFVCPHASLRVALVQPRERGGKLATQRYPQRTPAMAAGRTTRRWTTQEVLCHPLSLVSCARMGA